jgi:hypothetical protein
MSPVPEPNDDEPGSARAAPIPAPVVLRNARRLDFAL